MQIKVNQLYRDEFGRPSGVVAVNKPAGMTSHDVVDIARKALDTRKVGHAGALDPFATGLLLLLVGKATKKSDELIKTDKEYVTKVLFGLKTDSADTEGVVTESSSNIDLTGLGEALNQFTPEYEQFVSVYSSVKVNGEKLRVLARKYQNHELEIRDGKKIAKFYNDLEDQPFEVEVPKHLCQIPEIELLATAEEDISDSDFYQRNQDLIPQSSFPTAMIRVSCSKGTYIRVLGEDIGMALPKPTPAMLLELERTRIAGISLGQAISIDEIGNL